MKNKGYIKVWRKIEDWEWFDEATTFGFYIKLIMMANWKDKKCHGREVKRGELITSLANLSEAMKLSVRQTRTCLDKLEATRSITRLKDRNYTHIQINKYNQYQEKDKVDDKEATKKRQGSDKVATTTKEGKKGKKGKNIYTPTKKKKYSSLNDISETDIKQVADKYKVSVGFVNLQFEKLRNYCSSKGKRYKNYKSALRNFVLKDMQSQIERSKEYDKKTAIDARAILAKKSQRRV